VLVILILPEDLNNETKALVLFLLIALLMGCQRQEKSMIAFYYWKTTFKLSAQEKKTLAQVNAKKLYIRYFDVALNPKTNQPIPLAVIHFEESPKGFEVIPVVYIKNDVMVSKPVTYPIW